MSEPRTRGQTITVAQAAALLGRSERWVRGLMPDSKGYKFIAENVAPLLQAATRDVSPGTWIGPLIGP
jgi:hypothetical protein